MLVVEKTPLVGGTSAISGGGIWIPDNPDLPRVGIKDSIDAAFRYVKTCARGLASDERILAYVETARQMVRYLGEIGVPYRSMPLYADYYPRWTARCPAGAPWTRVTSTPASSVRRRWSRCARPTLGS